MSSGVLLRAAMWPGLFEVFQPQLILATAPSRLKLVVETLFSGERGSFRAMTMKVLPSSSSKRASGLIFQPISPLKAKVNELVSTPVAAETRNTTGYVPSMATTRFCLEGSRLMAYT